MNRLILAAFLTGSLLCPALAHAMPVFVAEPAVNSDVIAIAGGCGKGFHRGPYGGCLQNYADPAAHACPRGYHIGPGGGCRGNGR
jgi:hypothetical protein